MRRVTTVRSKAIPLNRANVDTDQIIPAKYLKRIERTGYGPFAFEAWRADPSFVLNDRRYDGAEVLIARQNFGSGSSREHAVWALEGLGIRAVIAPSFADIFKNNCFQSGLLTVELPEEDVDYLIARTEELPETRIEVDLASQTVRVAGGAWERRFEVDPFKKYRLARGLDDIAMTLEYEPDVAAFEATRPVFLPTTAR
ncbi:MAG TPA: 3-isopropylmalate dehydratase small subunit [Dehalococcoidia bacterium]